MENKNEIKSKVEFRQEIKQLQTMIDEIESMIQTLLEMNKNQQPTENAITH
jgi:prefoldin subunit 5